MLRNHEIEMHRVIYVVSFYFCFARYSVLSILAVVLIKELYGSEELIPYFMAGIACLPKISRLLMHRVFSRKKSIIASHFVFSLGVGIAMTIWALGSTTWSTFIAALMLEFCYLCASIKTKVIISELSTRSLLQDFSKLAVVNNVAACFGPLLAAGALSMGRFDLFCFLIIGLSIVAALLSLKLSSVELGKTSEGRIGLAAEKVSFVLGAELKLVLCASAVVCIFYSQINASLPMAVNQIFGGAYVGLVYAVNSICVMLFSIWVNKNIEKIVFGFYAKIALGLVLFGLAFLMLGVTSSLFAFIVAIVIFTFAEIVTLPALSEAVASTAPNQHKNLAFTLSSIATSIGEGIGMFIGTFLINYESLELSYVFATFAGLALLGATTANVLNRR